ncbi:MAG: hypothetical protein GF334_08120 [Candidatus Altiarchaeales archaeon]|nr:hypothetical protein [Candidatus Altiarchaeales archaeon]
MTFRGSRISKAFLNLDPAAINARERAIEFHIRSALEHVTAALHLLSQKKKRITGFSGQQFIRDAFSILVSTRKFLPAFVESQPDLMLYTEGDLVFDLGGKFQELEEALSNISNLAGNEGIDTTPFDEEVGRIGSVLLSRVSSFLEQLTQLSEGAQDNFDRIERALSGIVSLTSESRLIENLRRPGIRSEVERARDYLSSFMRSYVREKRTELEKVARTDRVRKKRERRNFGPRLPVRRFLVE